MQTILQQLEEKSSCLEPLPKKNQMLSFQSQVEYMVGCQSGGGGDEYEITDILFDEATNTLTIIQSGGNVKSVALNVSGEIIWGSF